MSDARPWGTDAAPLVTSAAAPPRPKSVGWSRSPTWVRSAILLMLVVAGWQAYASWSEFGGNAQLFASPLETARTLWKGWADGSLARPTWETLRVLFIGVGVGALIAAALTVLATLTQVGEDLLRLLGTIMNRLPGVAVLPLALVWFGVTTKAVVFATAIAAISPIASNLKIGFKTASPTLLAVGRNIGLSSFRLVTDVLVPAALPNAIGGLKAAFHSAWHTVVAAEVVFGVVGGGSGLGAYVNDAKLDRFTPRMFAALLTIALLGVLLDMLFGVLERRTIVRWGMRESS